MAINGRKWPFALKSTPSLWNCPLSLGTRCRRGLVKFSCWWPWRGSRAGLASQSLSGPSGFELCFVKVSALGSAKSTSSQSLLPVSCHVPSQSSNISCTGLLRASTPGATMQPFWRTHEGCQNPAVPGNSCAPGPTLTKHWECGNINTPAAGSW